MFHYNKPHGGVDQLITYYNKPHGGVDQLITFDLVTLLS